MGNPVLRLLVAFALLAPAAYAADEPQDASIRRTEIMQGVAEASRRVMGSCPARVWPGYDWSKLLFVQVTDSQSPQGLMFDSESRTIGNFPVKVLPEPARNSPYDFLRMPSSFVLVMSVEAAERGFAANKKRPDEQEVKDWMFETAVHEAFHTLVQQPRWSRAQNNSYRDMELPIQAAPRIYRRMLFDRLQEALLHPERRDVVLPKARYWLEKWKAEYPRDAAAATDRKEGTARYVEVLAQALANGGCDADEATVRTQVLSVLSAMYEKFGNAESGEKFEPDREGYDIGSSASFILRFSYPERDWQSEIAAGSTPVEALLSRFSPVEDEMDGPIEQKFESRRAALQKAADDNIEPAVLALKRKSSIIVALPLSWSMEAGNYSPLGSYTEARSSLEFIPLMLPLHFSSPLSSSKVRLARSRVTVSDHGVQVNGLADSPCPAKEEFDTFPVPKETVKKRGSTFELTDPHVSGKMGGALKLAADGRVWLCGR